MGPIFEILCSENNICLGNRLPGTMRDVGRAAGLFQESLPLQDVIYCLPRLHVFDSKRNPPPHNTEELKERIRHEIAEIPADMLRRIMGNIQLRLEECMQRNGSHLRDIVFRKLHLFSQDQRRLSVCWRSVYARFPRRPLGDFLCSSCTHMTDARNRLVSTSRD
ncbi:hypothetical protein C0J52_18666 [Blattella germanica]|nr:hypothetical protein C0J52_18666 [Blattella germanica]